MSAQRNWSAIAAVLVLAAIIFVVLSMKSFFPGWVQIAWVGAVVCFAGSFFAINEARHKKR